MVTSSSCDKLPLLLQCLNYLPAVCLAFLYLVQLNEGATSIDCRQDTEKLRPDFKRPFGVPYSNDFNKKQHIINAKG